MKLVIQKVCDAHVIVDQKTVGAIGHGYMILVGIEAEDTLVDVKKAADKVASLRIFEDEDGKMNLSIHDVSGQILSISQFTLCADVRKGNRPSFTKAMSAQEADHLYEAFNTELRNHKIHVESGIFQTHMNVVLNNDGPISIIMAIKDGKVL